MAQGLQVFDASGNIILDTSDRVGRILGFQRIESGTSGSITPTGYTNGTLFFSFQRDASWITGNTNARLPGLPIFTISGGTISWVSYSQYITNLGNTVSVVNYGGWLTYGVY